MLKEALYQTGSVPEGIDSKKVQQMMLHLLVLLEQKLEKKVYWAATCTVAVNAGYQAVARKIKRRKKLRLLIQECSIFCGVEDPTKDFPLRWEEKNLIYGYNAINEISMVTGMAPLRVVKVDFYAREVAGIKMCW